MGATHRLGSEVFLVFKTETLRDAGYAIRRSENGVILVNVEVMGPIPSEYFHEVYLRTGSSLWSSEWDVCAKNALVPIIPPARKAIAPSPHGAGYELEAGASPPSGAGLGSASSPHGASAGGNQPSATDNEDVPMSSGESEVVQNVGGVPRVGEVEAPGYEEDSPSPQSPKTIGVDLSSEDDGDFVLEATEAAVSPKSEGEESQTALSSDGPNPLNLLACPNANCFAGTYEPGVDDQCRECGADVRVNVALQLAVARQAERTEALSSAAGITMPSLRMHRLSAAAEKRLCKRTHRALEPALRIKAIALEKRARQKGYSGHEDRLLQEPQYTMNMIGTEGMGYPADFCASVLHELTDYAVWVGGVPPADKPRAPGGKGVVHAVVPKAQPPDGAGPRAPPPRGAGPKASKASGAAKGGKGASTQQKGKGGTAKGKTSSKRGGK
jgi:hypothetical protein